MYIFNEEKRFENFSTQINNIIQIALISDAVIKIFIEYKEYIIVYVILLLKINESRLKINISNNIYEYF